jgi:hypothetical protein
MSLVRVVALKSATGQLTSESRKFPCHTGRVGRLRVAPGSFSLEALCVAFFARVDFFFVVAMAASLELSRRNRNLAPDVSGKRSNME